MKLLIALTAVLAFFSCKIERKQTKQNGPLKQEGTLNLQQAVQLHLQHIDSFRKVNPDLIEAENIKLQQTLINYKQEIFIANDTLDFDWLYIVKSVDKKLCLVSWDTRMGGTMIEYASMALSKNTNGDVSAKMLIDKTNTESQNTYMHYDTIYIVQNNDRTLYIAHGFGQGSTAIPWQELRAFEITNNQLLEPTVFPDNKSNLFVSFDTHEFTNNERVPEIKIRDGGKTVIIPIATGEGGFSGRYQTIILTGHVYKAM